MYGFGAHHWQRISASVDAAHTRSSGVEGTLHGDGAIFFLNDEIEDGWFGHALGLGSGAHLEH
jgi:hypothetical protein